MCELSECESESEWLLVLVIGHTSVQILVGLSHHTHMWVLRVRSRVQQMTVLHLLTESLQCVDWLVELHWHGHLGEVLPNVGRQNAPHIHTPTYTRTW